MKNDTFQNMGDGDRAIRVVLSALLIGYTMSATVETLGWLSILPLLAIPLVMTAILSWDPVYRLLDVNTARRIPTTHIGFMTSNVGKTDTIVRYVLGATLLMAILTYAPTPLGVMALVLIISAALILTGIAAWDPFFAAFKLNTLEPSKHRPNAVIIQADFGCKAVPSKPVTVGPENQQPKVA